MPGEDIARIDDLILTIRGQRVILAADLARIYGVETRVLNQAVKRNLEKFPGDFVFQLSLEEAETVQRSRSQIVILKRGSNIKYLPHAFTEHGAIMAATVLKSPRAVQRKYDAQFKVVFGAIRQLMESPPPRSRRRAIGFRVEERRPAYGKARRARRGAVAR
jgi:hypothetical protein